MLLAKIPMKKAPIVNIMLLPMDAMKRKIALSDAGSTSTATKKVIKTVKIKVEGPLGLESNETLHNVVRKRRTEP